MDGTELEKGTELVPGRADITLETWQTAPQLRWSFQHVADLFPTAPIAAADVATPLPPSETRLGGVAVVHPFTGATHELDEVLARTDTDAWILTRNGRVIQEVYANDMAPPTRHLLMSVSKSVIGLVAGVLADRGQLDVEAPVTRYIPELHERGYDGATVRHLLDMRSGVRFSEDYLDPEAEVRLLEQAIGWAPRTAPGVPDSLHGFLATLAADRPHGEAFEYRSCETDVLGWACERAGHAPMAELVSDLVWRPIGAEFPADLAVDSHGAGMVDGGISAALRDLVRFGSVFLGDGIAFSGVRVASPGWIEDTLVGSPDSAEVFAASTDGPWMPRGMYRNQMWFPSGRRDVVACLGIHGQLVYINRSAGVVAAKLSSWATPQDPDKLFLTLAALDAASMSLSSDSGA